MYIHRYRYVDSGVDRIWECPRIFTQIWNMDTCLNMFEHPCSIYFRMMIFHDYMMIPQDVDQSPGTLDIE